MALNLGNVIFGVRANTGKSKRDLGELAQVLRQLESASVLAVGPLSGLGARIRALSAITQRGTLAAAAYLGGLTAVTVGILALGKASVQASSQINRITAALNTTTQSAFVSRQIFEEVAEEADRLGLNVETTARAFSQLAVAAQGTTLEGEQIREVFIGVSEAAAALRLNTSEVDGILRALQQTISKGRVQAEELRGQFGERLPGGFKLAAEALGVTTARLSDLLEAGEVTAEDLLPKLARVLRQRFGRDAESAANTVTGAVNKLSNAFLEFGDQINRLTGLSGRVIEFFNFLSRGLRGIQEQLKDIPQETRSVAEEIDRFLQRVELTGRAPADSIRRLRIEAQTQFRALSRGLAPIQERLEDLRAEAKAFEEQPLLGDPFGASAAAQAAVLADIQGGIEAAEAEARVFTDALFELEKAIIGLERLEPSTAIVPIEATDETEKLIEKIQELNRELLGQSKAFGEGKLFGAQAAQDILDLAEAEELLVDVSKQGAEQLAFVAEALNKLGIEGITVKAQIANLIRTQREAEESAEDLIDRYERTAEVLPEINREFSDLNEQINALQSTTPLRGFEESTEVRNKVRDLREELEETSLTTGEINAKTAEYQQLLQKLNDVELSRSKDAFAGLVDGLDDAEREFTAIGDLVRSQIPRAFQTAEDALVNFVTTGKFEIKAFVDFVIKELARLAVRAAITGALTSAFNAALGGTGGTGTTGTGTATSTSTAGATGAGGFKFSSAPGLAMGGVITSPGLFIGGEKGQEAVLPLTRGRGGRLGVASEGGGATVVNVNVINNTDSEVSVKRRRGQSGQEQLDITIDKIMARQVSNQGEFNSALRSNFQLNPRVAGR